MSPGVFVAVVVLLATAASRAQSSEQRRTWSGRSGVCVAVWLSAGPTWLATLLLLSKLGPHTFLIVMLLTTTIVLFPWPIVKSVLVPLGLPRAAYAVGRLADFTWGHDGQGGATLAAVLAVASRAAVRAERAAVRAEPRERGPRAMMRALWRRLWRPWSGDVAWARARVQKLDLLGAGGVLATAMLADLDGDEARADALCDTLDHFDPEVVPTVVRRLRAERSARRLMLNRNLDAVSRRERLLALDAAGSATVELLQASARRGDDDSAGAKAAAVWAWLRAPRRRRTWDLVAKPRPAPHPRAPADTITPPTDFGAAAQLHASLSAARTVRVHDVAALAAGWERATREAMETTKARALSLGVNADEATRGLERTVQDALRGLSARLDLSRTDVQTLPVVLQAAIADVRSERLDALEIAVAVWRQRLEELSAVRPDASPPIADRAPADELREWAALRMLIADVARTGDDGAYVAYEASQWVTCELAVHLWNVRREHRLANAMFRSLLAAAEQVSDTRDAETQRANVACGP